MALTAAERETIISTSDEDKFFVVQTSQRKVVTKLLRNKASEIIEDYTFEGTRFLTVKLPLQAISFRSPRGVKSNTMAAPKRKITAATCSATTAAGTPCMRIAKKDTGKCPAHSK
jgi:hypothetical protein